MGLGMFNVHRCSQSDECFAYAQVGVGRDDGVAAGEFSPIFYKTCRFSSCTRSSYHPS
jgi:hypothetical protein